MVPNSHSLVLIVVLSVLQLTSLRSVSSEPAVGRLSKHPVLLAVSYDGFRYDYMTKTETPHLQAIKNEGVSVPYMEAQFPTKTFPNHHSIATGLYPDSHGVVDNSLYDPLLNKTLSGFNAEDEPQFWNFRDDVLPIWIRNEQAGDERISGCYMWAGSSTKYGSDRSLLPHYVIPTYNESVPWETRVETVISWITNADKPANLVFLYYNEPDGQGHAYGTDDEVTLAEVRKSDNRTGFLVSELKKAGIYDDINLIVLSDHGMQTVTSANIINITAMVDPSLYNRYGGSPLYQIQPKEATNFDLLYNTFKNESSRYNFSAYSKSEMGFLNFTENRRVMDLVLLADEGYAFDDASLNANGVGGIHGYDNGSPSMRALFLARGPLFKKGYLSPSHFDNVDIVPLISKIMNIPMPQTNGTLNVVSQFLSDVSSSTTNPTTPTISTTPTTPTISSSTTTRASTEVTTTELSSGFKISNNVGALMSTVCLGLLLSLSKCSSVL